MKTPSIIIVTNDTFVAIGMSQILRNTFNIRPNVLTYTTDIEMDIDRYDLVILDSDIYLAHQTYFSSRKKKCIILSASIRGENIITHTDKESDMIDFLSGKITELSEKDTEKTELSQREIEVLRQITNGLTNKEIADTLNISINTVLSHRKNITSKLGIKSVSGLSVYAMMNGYI